jgi:plasmid stability protein
MTLNLPGTLYGRLKRRAERANRSVEEELLDVLAAAIPDREELPDDLAKALAPLALLKDDDLWRAARSRLAADLAAQLEDLHLKKQREGLADAEAQHLASLIRQYERAMLIRAEAAALLHQRGYDVTELTTPV